MLQPSIARVSSLAVWLVVASSCGGHGAPTEVLPSTDNEPQFESGISRDVLLDDFERYTDGASFSAGGWGLAGPVNQRSAPAGSGTAGTKAVEFVWHVGDGWLGMDHGVAPQSGSRVAYLSYDYRAPGFVYATSNPAQQGKKHMIINLGETNRITIGLNSAMDIGMTQSDGSYLWEQPSKTPWGSQLATVNRFTDGKWHRVTVKRTAESRNGAMDGAIELWVDGQKLFDLQKIGTGSIGIVNVELAGTLNGNSAVEQREYYDNVRVWY